MHLVVKSAAPAEIVNMPASETDAWVTYFNTQPRPTKPKGRWTEAPIRNLIESDFSSSCCYCGIGLGVSKVQKSGNQLFQGQVDHFLPKSKRPDLVYQWENLLWSCSSCNSLKGEYYAENKQEHMLNPSLQADMACLEYLHSSGNYGLKTTVATADFDEFMSRLDITQTRTHLNSGQNPQRRKTHVTSLLSAIEYYLRDRERLEDPDFPEYLKPDMAADLATYQDQAKTVLASGDYPALLKQIILAYEPQNPEQKPFFEQFLMAIGFLKLPL